MYTKVFFVMYRNFAFRVVLSHWMHLCHDRIIDDYL